MKFTKSKTAFQICMHLNIKYLNKASLQKSEHYQPWHRAQQTSQFCMLTFCRNLLVLSLLALLRHGVVDFLKVITKQKLIFTQ